MQGRIKSKGLAILRAVQVATTIVGSLYESVVVEENHSIS